MPGAERRTAVAVLDRMPWAGRPLCGDEGRLDVRCVRENFSKPGPTRRCGR
jgi:hypothetical protein